MPAPDWREPVFAPRWDGLHPNHGVPEGNDHATGHEGAGGAPEGNTNALTHGGYASRDQLSGMSPEDREWFKKLQRAVVSRLGSSVVQNAVAEDIVWLFYCRSLADAGLADRGIALENGEMNPFFPRSRRLSSRAVRLLSELVG